MRAPGEAPGLMALEVAMDEMAEKLGLDPVEFRILNDTQVDPEIRNVRSRTRLLSNACAPGRKLRLERAQRQPGPVRDGRWLVGMGMAAAIRGAIPSSSRARAYG
jgi:xanthine dehydrogenase YagR molybdenum-binding subunit